jgi:GTP-binding protein
MLDNELEAAIAQELPADLPHIFISSIIGKGIIALKDLLWKELNKFPFHDVESIVRKQVNVTSLPDEDAEDDEQLYS